MLEDQLKDAKVGPVFSCLIREQFVRTRNADRFWYERLYSKAKQDEIKKSSLAELICLNTDIDRVTKDVFLLPKLQEFVNCTYILRSNLNAWKESEDKKCN